MTAAHEIWPDAIPASEMDSYSFDLNGFIVVRGALSRQEVQSCNETIDAYQDMKADEWRGYCHGHDYGGNEGINIQQIYEAGPAFECLIDHPSWIAKVQHFIGGAGFDHSHGPIYIDECFASIRKYGESIGMHSGGQEHCLRTQFGYTNERFNCCQVNVLMAFNDVGPGDGATMVIPASHKANLWHPQVATHCMREDDSRSMDGVEGAIEVHLQAGDAILFVDSIMHGSAARVNDGQRRIGVYRYGVSWGRSRHGYQASSELLERLNEKQRQIISPGENLVPPQYAAHIS
ncbi:MAG: phytanoyl-CoA dioxygenase family protein [Planctomycetes bacterium]|nr:phytanoyl-CoA dioxygenase family protein [Planctomycetota bacterium]